MEINEKLDIFYKAAIDAANEQSDEILKEQKRICEESLAEHRKMRQEGAGDRVRLLEEAVRREVNRSVSERILDLKREYQRRQQELREELFSLVEEKIAAFRASGEYPALLARKIRAAKEYADGGALTVYIDPSDAGLLDELSRQSGCELTVAGESFGGGIRAVMPEKNVLMDESFAGKLAAEKEKLS